MVVPVGSHVAWIRDLCHSPDPQHRPRKRRFAHFMGPHHQHRLIRRPGQPPRLEQIRLRHQLPHQPRQQLERVSPFRCPQRADVQAVHAIPLHSAVRLHPGQDGIVPLQRVGHTAVGTRPPERVDHGASHRQRRIGHLALHSRLRWRHHLQHLALASTCGLMDPRDQQRHRCWMHSGDLAAFR